MEEKALPVLKTWTNVKKTSTLVRRTPQLSAEIPEDRLLVGTALEVKNKDIC